MKKNKSKQQLTKQALSKQPQLKEILDYDSVDTSSFISEKSLKFKDIGIQLPQQAPTQVVSIRLPTALLNKIKAYSSQRDVPYQSVIKLFLNEKMEKV